MDRQSEIEGVIFKIKRFSLHDGPGIRTSIFLKGCPLNCIWCHSPEGISKELSVWYNINICIKCGLCVEACPEKALSLMTGEDPYITINREFCKMSGKCVKICPANATQFTGHVVNVPEILKEIEKDVTYYRASGGGITLTGGEPLFQPEFSAEILKECRKRDINTTIETSLFCEKDVLELVSDIVDLFIVDIKIFNTDQHNFYTGKHNKIIKDNFKYIAAMGKKIIVRIPIVENITDKKENLKAISDFVRKTRNDITIEEIKFNPLTTNNYMKLGIPYLLK
jgi:pyruvate formate lyase activating enzyme